MVPSVDPVSRATTGTSPNTLIALSRVWAIVARSSLTMIATLRGFVGIPHGIRARAGSEFQGPAHERIEEPERHDRPDHPERPGHGRTRTTYRTSCRFTAHCARRAHPCRIRGPSTTRFRESIPPSAYAVRRMLRANARASWRLVTGASYRKSLVGSDPAAIPPDS